MPTKLMSTKPKGILKLEKTPTGTKQVATSWKGGFLTPQDARITQKLNNVTWTRRQLEKLKRIGKANAEVVKSQNYLLKEHKILGREKPRNPFENTPVTEIAIDHKNGNLVFTQGVGADARRTRVTRMDLLQNEYYKETGLFDNVLNSRRLTTKYSRASLEYWKTTKKRKVVELMKFLKKSNLNEVVSLNNAKEYFTLPEILVIGKYAKTEIVQHYNPQEIANATRFLENNKNALQVYKSLGF